MSELGVDPSQMNDTPNVDMHGNFSVQVLRQALSLKNLQCVRFGSEHAREAEANPENEEAFICNLAAHWYAIRKLNGKFYDLNSLNEGPLELSDAYLGISLATILKEEKGAVFAVSGPFLHANHASQASASSGKSGSHKWWTLDMIADLKRRRQERAKRKPANISEAELAANPELRRALEESKREVDPSYGGQQSAGVDDDIRRAMELSRQEQGLPPSADFMSDEDQIKQAINLSLQEQNQGDSSSSSTTSSMYPQSPPPPSSSSSRAAAAPSSLPAASASMSDDEAEMARAIAMSLQDVDSPPSSSSSSSGARPVASSHPFSSAGHSLSSSSSSKPKQNVDADMQRLMKQNILNDLPPEPAADEPDAVTVQITFRSTGKKAQRRFRRTDKAQLLYQFTNGSFTIAGSYDLVTPPPPPIVKLKALGEDATLSRDLFPMSRVALFVDETS